MPFLALASLLERRRTQRRRLGKERPRLVYGPVPIINIKYMSRAMRQQGYLADTVVGGVYAINHPSDFDVHTQEIFGRSRAGRLLQRLIGPYVVFVRTLRNYDIFHFFFDGGFLAFTPLAFWELSLLHLARKLVIAMPYGSDVAVPSHMRSLAWRHGLMRTYPRLGREEPRTLRWIQHFTQHADYVVAGLVHNETLPRWDLLTILYYPVDTTTWDTDRADPGHDGRTGPVTVVHAPNHRAMKGTEFLVAACEQLAREGLDVRLRLLEGEANEVVRQVMTGSDIVADQFILGYALTALEGMSLGKPVLSNISDATFYDVFRQQTRFADCPIVHATPEDLSDQLRRLVTNPTLRKRIGLASRDFVLREHSYEAMGKLWHAIYRRVWWQEPIEPADLLRPDTPDATHQD